MSVATSGHFSEVSFLCTITLIFGCLVLQTNAMPQSNLANWQEIYRSKAYKVQIIQGNSLKNVFTYGLAKKSNTGWQTDSEGMVSFCSFSTDAVAKIRIYSLNSKVSSFNITPRSLRSRALLNGQVLNIALKPLEKAWITLNGNEGSPLFLFCDPPKPSVPSGCIYFGPGIHLLKQPCHPANRQTIYMDRGAWVVGSIDLRARSHVRVMGPGVLSGEEKLADSIYRERDRPRYSMIIGDQNQNSLDNRVEGITIVDSPTYNFVCGPDHISNVKLISPWHWSTDGFQMIPRGNGTAMIENCFAFVGDDVFFPRENFRGNIEIRDCLVASCNNSVFQLCYWGDSLHHNYQAWIHNITVRSFIKGQGAVFRASLDRADHLDTGFKNMLFENILIENGLQVPLFQIENRPYYFGRKTYASCGNSSNIVFRNITVEGNAPVRSTLLGLNSRNGHHDYLFEKVTINGLKIDQNNFGSYFQLNDFCSGIRFQP